MKNFDQHKIGIADMEVEIEPVVDAFSFRNEVRSVFYDDLLPGLEELFNELQLSEQTLILDSIMIDVGELSLKQWKKELVEKAIREVKRILGSLHTKIITTEAKVVTQTSKLPHPVDEIKSLKSVVQLH